MKSKNILPQKFKFLKLFTKNIFSQKIEFPKIIYKYKGAKYLFRNMSFQKSKIFFQNLNSKIIFQKFFIWKFLNIWTSILRTNLGGTKFWYDRFSKLLLLHCFFHATSLYHCSLISYLHLFSLRKQPNILAQVSIYILHKIYVVSPIGNHIFICSLVKIVVNILAARMLSVLKWISWQDCGWLKLSGVAR